MILAAWKPKTTIFAVFFCLRWQNQSIYMFFFPGPSKDNGIYAVFSVLQDVVSIYGNIKTPYFTMFLFPDHRQTESKNGSKRTFWRLCQAIMTHLDPSWSYVGPVAHLGAMLASYVGPSWGYVEPSCGYVGPSSCYVGPSWVNLLAHVGPMLAHQPRAGGGRPEVGRRSGGVG